MKQVCVLRFISVAKVDWRWQPNMTMMWCRSQKKKWTFATPRLTSAKPLLSSAKPLLSSAKLLLSSAMPLLTSAGSSWAVFEPISADLLSTSSLLEPTCRQLVPTWCHIEIFSTSENVQNPCFSFVFQAVLQIRALPILKPS